ISAPAPLHLPSFPTRRSSDLNVPGPVPGAAECAAPIRRVRELQPAHVLGGTDRRHTVVRADLADGVGQVVADGALGQVEPTRDLDRKSTRLNSSHVSISYAVF